MKLNIALEWFINPDHLPLIAVQDLGYLKKFNCDLNIVEPNEHYDGFNALKNSSIEFAVNEPLHLIEQFDNEILSLGTFFITRGGVMLTKKGEHKLRNGENIKISTPVDNEKTDSIAKEILSRYMSKQGLALDTSKISFDCTDFHHMTHIKNGYDGAWLVFYNFECISAIHEKIDVVLIESTNGDFPNFSALDIFTTKQFYNQNTQNVENLLNAIKKAIKYIKENPSYAKNLYYKYTNTNPTPLMDDIIIETLKCFDENFSSNAYKQKEILDFFNITKISNLDYTKFKTAFLQE